MSHLPHSLMNCHQITSTRWQSDILQGQHADWQLHSRRQRWGSSWQFSARFILKASSHEHLIFLILGTHIENHWTSLKIIETYRVVDVSHGSMALWVQVSFGLPWPSRRKDNRWRFSSPKQTLLAQWRGLTICCPRVLEVLGNLWRLYAI